MDTEKRNIELVRKYTREKSMGLFGKINIWMLGVSAFLLISVFLVFVSFSVGMAIGKHQFSDLVSGKFGAIYSSPSSEDVLVDVDFQPFWDAWVLLEDNFVGGASVASSTTEDDDTDQDRVWGAIEGLTRSYGDPFTSFLPPEESENFAADIAGEFSGVGMEIGNRDGYLTVISPLPGTPADRAGMLPQDVISKIDGVDALRMPTEQAVKLIRGPKGEPVELTILRSGEIDELTITVVRDVIKIPTLETAVIDDVFVIKLYSFTAESPKLFQNAIKEMAESGKDKLILDLRGNPGGYLEAAISMSSWFLPADKTIVTEEYGSGKPNKEHVSAGYDVFSDNLKMAILVNGGSASASEIVAGALRDHNIALLLGDTTFGKGSVQELFNLTKETSIKITIAKWLTPSGDHISEDGIVPDIFLAPIERDDSDEGSYNSDLSQDQQIIDTIKVLQRSDFKQLFDSVPEELQYRTATSTIEINN